MRSTETGFTPHDFDCPVCSREVTEDHRDLFYMDRRLIEPLDTSDGEMVCSGKCKSQYEFNRLCPADQQVLKEMARAAYAWWVGTEACTLGFKLTHGRVSTLVDAVTFGAAEMGMKDLLKRLAGEEFLNNDSDGPVWFQKAVGLIQEPLLMPVKPAREPFDMVGMVNSILGGAR